MSCVSLNSYTRVAALHYTQKWSCKMRTSESLLAVKKPDSAKPNHQRKMKKIGLQCKFSNQPLRGGGFSTFPLKFLVKLWVEPYSSPALSGKKVLFPIIQCFTLMIRFGNISLLCRITWKSTLRYNHILYTTNNIFWYKFNSLYVPFDNTTINPL